MRKSQIQLSSRKDYFKLEYKMLSHPKTKYKRMKTVLTENL